MANAASTKQPQAQPEPLSESIFSGFQQMLSPDQIRELYKMCLDDADRRIRQFQQSPAPPDESSFRGAMHAIKGTCGMVGAVELAARASALELGPIPTTSEFSAYEEFLCASAHLRRILAAKSIPL